ncbi:uncharacterized protein LOC134665483 [Cydia fagiglandana]|uniref:uncharacterized protein LOC134665483 n=1 Tax=Cydia fagiglandana TaxID=1458189 RepID=UPI002FEE1CE7
MDAMRACRCCLLRPPDKDLTTPYTHLGQTETYADMIKQCFDINLVVGGSGSCGICSMCVGRLRDASDFKLQVQHSQAELRARTLGASGVKEEESAVEPENPEMQDIDGTGDPVSGESTPLQSNMVALNRLGAVLWSKSWVYWGWGGRRLPKLPRTGVSGRKRFEPYTPAGGNRMERRRRRISL